MEEAKIKFSSNISVCITYPGDDSKKQISHGLISGDRESHLNFTGERALLTIIEKNNDLKPNCRRADFSFSYADVIYLFSELLKELRDGYGTTTVADLYSALVEARDEMNSMESEIKKMEYYWERRRQEG